MNVIVVIALLLMPSHNENGIRWEREYAAALEQAREENTPIFLAFNMDGEGANENTALKVYRDPELVERSRDFICLIASTCEHESRAEVIGGESRQVCGRFGSVTCAEHLAVEIRASEAYIGRNTVIAPQHILLTPNGKVVVRKAYQASLRDLCKMMDMATKEVARAASGGDSVERRRLKKLRQQALERNANRREEAISELGRLSDLQARNTLFSLVKRRKGNQDATRIAAIDALATRGNYDALEILIGCLKDHNNIVITHAIVALERIELPQAVPPLMKLWKKKPKALIAKEIPRALAKCGPGDEDVRELVRKAARSAKATMVKMSAIVALASLDCNEENLEILSDKFTERSGNLRGLAAWSLGTLKDTEGIAILERALQDETNTEVRECMEAAIRNIQIESGPDDARFADMLRRFITDCVAR